MQTVDSQRGQARENQQYDENFPPVINELLEYIREDANNTIMHNKLQELLEAERVVIYIEGVKISICKKENSSNDRRYTKNGRHILQIGEECVDISDKAKRYFIKVCIYYPKFVIIDSDNGQDRNIYRAIKEVIESRLGKYFKKEKGRGVALKGGISEIFAHSIQKADQVETREEADNTLRVKYSSDKRYVVCTIGRKKISQVPIDKIDTRIVGAIQRGNIPLNRHTQDQLALLGLRAVRDQDKKDVKLERV